MAFRITEERERLYNEVKRSYVNQLPEPLIPKATSALLQIVSKWGTPVTYHPIWHPLNEFAGQSGFFQNREDFDPEHEQAFLNAILYCPYDDGEDIINAVRNLPEHPYVTIGVQRLEATLWNEGTSSILVTCEWKFDALIPCFGTFKLSKVAPLFLEKVQPDLIMGEACRAMPWERFAPLALGEPCGKVSSLFLAKPEGQCLKRLWEVLCDTGMFKPKDC